MKINYSRRAIMLISGLLLLPGCYKAKNSSASPLQPDVTHAVNVDEIWRKNEKIVDNALSGRGYSVEEFGRACDFFEKTTGIEIRGNGSFFGWLANGDTAVDFKKVRAWYSVNHDRLYWDKVSKSVKVRDRGSVK